MSNSITVSQEGIAAAGVRVGDLIRVKLKPEPALGWLAPNTVESVDVRVTTADWFESIARIYDSISLLERVVELPTTPYSVIAPPEKERHNAIPLILDYWGTGELEWTQDGDRVPAEEVAAKLQNGWLPVGALDRTTEGDS